MLSLFHVGESYRDLYQVEYVVRFFDGELAVARKDSFRYYLQSAHLRKQAPSRAITQYRSLRHSLIIPFEEVYTEERSIVFIRPYVPIHPLREVISTHEVNEDQVIQWVKQLLVLEKELKSKPMKMYLLLDPRNIGLTEDDELRVFFCGIEKITAQPKTLDWGTFIYSLLGGEYLEEPLDKVPADFDGSKWLIRLIQRSLRNDSPESVLSHIEYYERKKEGKGLLGFLFKGEKKVRQKIRETLDQGRKESPSPDEGTSPGTPVSANEAEKPDSPEKKVVDPILPDNQIHTQEEERFERLRQEFERRQKELLEKQRLELERRQQELLEQQRQEFARREEVLLNQQKEEFRQQIEEPEQQKNWEREQQERERQLEEQKQKEEEKARLEKEQLERELRKEQELMAKEQEERLKAELKKVEQERLKWEQKQKDLEKKEEELREKLQREFDQMVKALMEKQEKEFERRQKEMLEKQRELLENQTRQRLEKQREELEQTSRHYLIVPRKKPQASLIDFGKEEKEKKQERSEKEQQEELKCERERLRKEKLAREKAEHDHLVKQFEEYMNQMYHTD
ncbi:hypothetical protein [Thermoactinomyces mirandus]|uniref:Uncharacterized protein n=1 Tax=Thermoactinomyces mirandus TaxID=2756294 RepID=A0A7W1XQ40_9BACL|nr:hypothetical protein [Thermoactinomyces mirandus]MBA4601097.1 hypothetical protein [Thermoactinomyces mirandus]